MHALKAPQSFVITSLRTPFRTVRGAYRRVRSVGNRFLNFIDQPIVILVYHRVINLASDPEMIAVSPGNFRQQMEFLKQRFQLLRLSDKWPDLREPAVIITFDDGYADNVLQALPILEDVGVPATFFVSTAHVNTGRIFWWHRLEAILLREGEFPCCFELQDPRFGRTWQTASLEQRKVLYSSLGMLMRRLDPDHQEDWLGQLEQWNAPAVVPAGLHRLITREELKKLVESPWATVGAHTVSHVALSAFTEAQQREEIFSSKTILEEMTGKEITTFSYPFGRKSEYNHISIDLCREAGFIRAAANFPGQVHRWTDPLQLPRHLVRNWGIETFAAEMKNFWTR